MHMVKTQFIDIPDELKNVEQKAIERRDRFFLGAAQSHKREMSKKQKRILGRLPVINSPMVGRGSLFRYFSPLWKALTTTQKNVWKTAGVYSSLSGWQLFVSDNAARLQNDLTLEVPPSNLWQVRAGRILIESPATEIILKQEHPQDYWVTQKIAGRSWASELVLINETFSLPLEIQIRYKSNLSATGPTQSAKFYAQIWSSYQGEDIYTNIEIPFSASVDWTYATASLSVLRGIIVGYTLFIEIIGYTGELMYDNIRAIHSAQNWARDPRCDDISKTFEKQFSLVPPFWVPVSLPTGSSYVSQYGSSS